MSRAPLVRVLMAMVAVTVSWAADAPVTSAPVTSAPAAGVPAAAPVPAKTKESLGAFSHFAEEEKWNFDPQKVNRQDIFYDLEALLAAQIGVAEVVRAVDDPISDKDELGALREWAKRELVRIESFILVRKWDDALKATETDLKKIQPRVGDDSAIAQIAEKMKRYRSQAEDAKILEEAQAKFDALGLKVEGILWSPAGSLAVISGEPRARAMNERVKDCVIINIDTNRVDFLFHYNRRRFEFQRYVGEDATSGKTK